MDPRPISFHHFYSLCTKWRENHPSEDPKFKLFLELLDISEKGFESDCHDPGYITDMKFALKSRINWLEKSQDWVELIRIWEEFQLGTSQDDIQYFCGMAIEALVAEGRPSVAAKIAVKHALSKDLKQFALSEYERACDVRECNSEFQEFCRNAGIQPGGPTP